MSSPSTPSGDEVIAAAAVIRRTQPTIGRAKMLAQLKAENNWQLSEARLKKLVTPVNATPGQTAGRSNAPKADPNANRSRSSASSFAKRRQELLAADPDRLDMEEHAAQHVWEQIVLKKLKTDRPDLDYDAPVGPNGESLAEMTRAGMGPTLQEMGAFLAMHPEVDDIDDNGEDANPTGIPSDAPAAQERYREDSTRAFKLYGRGEYDYGVSPNSDMGILFQACLTRIKEFRALTNGAPLTQVEKQSLAVSMPLMRIWDSYCAAGRMVGLSRQDVGRQVEAEYGVNPIPYLLSPPTEVEKARKRAEFKKQSLGMKKQLLRSLPPDMAHFIPVDAKGEPVWKEHIHGEFCMLVVKINKGDGLTEYGEVEWDPSSENPGQSILRWV